jgi:predicted  nucleic acid-binding Zn-ribbon protein
MHKHRDERFQEANKTVSDLFVGHKADVDRILKQEGKKHPSQLTGDAAAQFQKIDEAFKVAWEKERAALPALTNMDNTMTECARTIETEGSRYSAVENKLEALGKEIDREKIRLRQEDPGITALVNVTVEKAAKRDTYIRALPDFAKCQAEYVVLSGKIAKIQRQIAQLMRGGTGYPLAMKKTANQGDER